MTKTLLALHVIAAIIAVGPVTVAASMFPRSARRAAAGGAGRVQALAQLELLRRICGGYALVGVAVPVFGLATAASLHVLGSPWLLASMALTAVAAVVLAAVILPVQDAVRRELDTTPAVAASASAAASLPAAVLDRARTARLAMVTGLFNLLWATVTVLMILRPGSTTGV